MSVSIFQSFDSNLLYLKFAKLNYLSNSANKLANVCIFYTFFMNHRTSPWTNFVRNFAIFLALANLITFGQHFGEQIVKT